MTQIHYNQGADLFTYLNDPSVFAVKEGYVDAPSGTTSALHRSRTRSHSVSTVDPGLGININEALVRETAEKCAQQKAWRNEVWTGPDGSLREW